MEKAKIQCPECGANLEVSISKTSTTGKPYPKSTPSVDVVTDKRLNPAQAKIKQLEAAGFNTTNLFSIRVAEGDYKIARIGSDGMEIVPADDQLYKDIRKSRVIPNRRLFRRWVMAQVFRMMTEKDYKTGKVIGFTAALKNKGYRYQWKMVIEELRVQAQLYQNDMENYKERNIWFNKGVVTEMMAHHIAQLKEIVGALKPKKCKGIPYIHLGGKDIFVSDIDKNVFQPLYHAMALFQESDNPMDLYKVAKRFYDRTKLSYIRYDMPQCKAFQNAYKGAGAYFTLKNLILFHGCTFEGVDSEKSLRFLKDYSKAMEGWELLGVLKAFLSINNISIEAKQAEWKNQ